MFSLNETKKKKKAFQTFIMLILEIVFLESGCWKDILSS